MAKIEIEVRYLENGIVHIKGPAPFPHEYYGEGVLFIETVGNSEDEALAKFNEAWTKEIIKKQIRDEEKRLVSLSEPMIMEVEVDDID